MTFCQSKVIETLVVRVGLLSYNQTTKVMRINGARCVCVKARASCSTTMIETSIENVRPNTKLHSQLSASPLLCVSYTIDRLQLCPYVLVAVDLARAVLEGLLSFSSLCA